MRSKITIGQCRAERDAVARADLAMAYLNQSMQAGYREVLGFIETGMTAHKAARSLAAEDALEIVQLAQRINAYRSK
jgi:hypothetical protein